MAGLYVQLTLYLKRWSLSSLTKFSGEELRIKLIHFAPETNGKKPVNTRRIFDRKISHLILSSAEVFPALRLTVRVDRRVDWESAKSSDRNVNN